jgi:hypothetical protein
MRTTLGVLLLLTSMCARGANEQWPTWEGWELMGSPGVFSYETGKKGSPLLVGSFERGGAALRKDAEQLLTPDLELSWQWAVAKIPSNVAEDTQEKHHYFAVSVIFDNGKNLSYIWSAALPKEYSFQCPLEEWKDKETHVVVETGAAGFNHVLSYKRNIAADYAHFIGGELPAKITKVWIVARVKGGENPVTARLLGLALGSAQGVPKSYL